MAARMLAIMLHHEDLMDAVLSAMVDLEITGAVVLDGTSMEQVLIEDVPIFAGLWQDRRDGNARIKTILALADAALVDPLMRLCKDAGVDLTDPDTGRVVSWAVEYHRGPDASEGV